MHPARGACGVPLSWRGGKCKRDVVGGPGAPSCRENCEPGAGSRAGDPARLASCQISSRRVEL
jgi:hypothetical protein